MLRRSSADSVNPWRFDEAVQHVLQVFREQLFAGRRAIVRVEHLVQGRRASESVRPLAREQPRHEIGAIVGHLDDRLVHQVLEHVLAADVDDERHARMERRDVGEVLIGPHAEIHAVGRHALRELGNDFLERRFVRDEIVGSEKSVRLGEVRDHLPERAVRQLLRQVVGRDAVAGAEQRHPGQAEERGDDDENVAASQHLEIGAPLGGRSASV